jgi:NADPH2:quinone reductase
MKAHAIRFHRTGGPEVLEWEEVEVGEPGPGELRLRQTAVGVNFIDVYHRSGLYPVPLPSGLGTEAAGVVEAVGPDVSDFKPGDRVAYGTGPLGAYAEARVMPARHVVKLPENIGERQAAGMMLRGMTAQYLLRRTYRVKSGDRVLIHAAAGGVGLILVQWAKHLGATVIGTAGSQAKADIAKAHGADHVILYGQEDFPIRVRELTSGDGVQVVYDGVGKATFMGSLDSLALRGMMVSFGNASGAVPPFDLLLLARKGSLFVTRPTLASYTATRDELVASASDLFDIVGKGAVKIEIGQTFPLRDAAEAHRALEGRATTGSTILLP